MYSNPMVKKGDLIIVKNTNTGCEPIIGATCEVISVGLNSFNVKELNGQKNQTWCVDFVRDCYVLADRKANADRLKNKIKELENKIDKLRKEIYILEKYETDEDMLGDKIKEILENKTDAKAIAKIIKELKEFNIVR